VRLRWLFIAAGSALASAETGPEINQAEPRNRTAMAVGCLVLVVAPLLIVKDEVAAFATGGPRSWEQAGQELLIGLPAAAGQRPGVRGRELR
jgi:hypothetical protein